MTELPMNLTKVSQMLSLCMVVFAASCAGALAQEKSGGEIDLARCWEYKLSKTDAGALASDGVRTFVGLEGGRVEALSIDGKLTWSSEFGGEIASDIIVDKNAIFVATAVRNSDDPKAGNGSALRSLSNDTGITNWTTKLPDAERHFLYIHNGRITVVSSNGTIESFDAADGKEIWRREIAASFVGEPFFSNEKIIVAAGELRIFTVNVTSGEISNLKRTQFQATSVANGLNLIVGDERGNISLFTDDGDKAYWRFKSGGAVNALILGEGRILAASNDNFVYLLASNNGSVVWKRRLAGRITNVQIVAGGYIAAATLDTNNVVFLEPSKGKVAGQAVLENGDELSHRPVSAAGSVYLLSRRSVFSYSISGCPK